MAARLNKKYFGNRNTGTTGTADDGIGGEGVASVTITNGGSNFDSGTTTVTFSAPQIPNGVTATGTATIVAGVVTAVTITNKGSGYTSAPSVTIADPDGGLAEGAVTLTRTMTNTEENAIIARAYIGGSRKVVDIVGQKGARRYKVTDGTDTEVCTLMTGGASSAAGEMDITAYDSDGGEYWVLKLNNRRCTVVAKGGGSGGSQFATNSSVSWTLGAATEDVTVQIENA